MKNKANGVTTMVKLDTVQRKGKLNDVYALEEAGEPCAYRYVIVRGAKPNEILSHVSFQQGPREVEGSREEAKPNEILSHVSFQQGPRGVEGSREGVLVSDLLEIVKHQLEHYQQGEFATKENEIALEHVENALIQMNKRVEDRLERQVLGKNEK